MDKEEFQKRRSELQCKTDDLFSEIESHSKEEMRTINVLHKAPQILNRLEQTFEDRTSLSKTDCVLLFLATALQLVRIYLLPKFEEKYKQEDRIPHNDDTIKKMEHEEINKYKKDHQHWTSIKGKKNYRSWQEIAFTVKVPYDATRHSGEGFNNRNMHGGQHRVKSLGHDPVLGWIFGTCNIITDTITIAPECKLGEKKIRIPYVESYDVDMGSNFCWKNRTSTFSVFNNSIESVKEDKHRLAAAVFAQGLHLASDKYTNLGLPIPFLSLIDQDEAYEIYKKGYDYLDYNYDIQILSRTMKSAERAMLINAIISRLHFLFYNPQEEPNMKLYAVRTRKILSYSNLLATTSDVIQTAFRVYNGDKNALENFDIGGFLVTLYRLISDVTFIQKIKEEFIFKEWDKIMESNNNIYNI